MGSFTAAQVIADLKYTPGFIDAEDWYTFVEPGPGSLRGLNIVMGRQLIESVPRQQFKSELHAVREELLPRFAGQGWATPCSQNVQNMFCELSKYIRGSSRNVYKPFNQ